MKGIGMITKQKNKWSPNRFQIDFIGLIMNKKNIKLIDDDKSQLRYVRIEKHVKR